MKVMKIRTLLLAAVIGIMTVGLSEAAAQSRSIATGDQKQPREAAFNIPNTQAHTASADASVVALNATNYAQVEFTRLPGRTEQRDLHHTRTEFSLMPASYRIANGGRSLLNIAPVGSLTLPVTAGGTLGRITKWAGFTGSNSVIGDPSHSYGQSTAGQGRQSAQNSSSQSEFGLKGGRFYFNSRASSALRTAGASSA